MPPPNPTSYHGWLFLDKPFGLSSNSALQKIRHIFNRVKAGHVGTLDPLASGVLPIALGEATKLIPLVEKTEKVYEFEVTWGERRSTDDAEGEVLSVSSARPLADRIEKALPCFVGEVDQVPPLYSAIKVDGRAAYAYARSQQDVILKSRKVFIKKLTLMKIISQDRALFQMECGSGVYVRSLARDLAIFLGTEGYVSYLRRLKVGMFDIQDCLPFQKILEFHADSKLKECVHSMDVVLDDIPVVVFAEDICDRFYKGQSLSFSIPTLPTSVETIVVCKSVNGLCGLLTYKDGALAPKRMFNHLNLRR
ncbi:MAG: tRNA pseudouridine(55) synthase TruB [Alphaproteobacteria bacterium]